MHHSQPFLSPWNVPSPPTWLRQHGVLVQCPIRMFSGPIRYVEWREVAEYLDWQAFKLP